MKKLFSVLLVATATFFAAQESLAQNGYPDKVVKIVVPFAAGGSTDLFARVLAERLGVLWNQSVIVENRPGASAAIGTEVVAKSKGDGYTLLLGTATSHAVAPALVPTLPYNVLHDFVPITEMATAPFVLLVHPTLPVKTLKEFIAYGKSKPGVISYNGAPGTGPHMAMELLLARAGGVSMQSIAYKGTGPAMIDLVSGQLHAGFNDVPASLSFVREGRLRALAVTGTKRTPLMPDVPTVAESGYAGYDADAWFGLFAPATTNPQIVSKIAADIRTALSEPAARKKLEEGAFSMVLSSPSQFEMRVRNDLQKWRKVVSDNNIKAN